MIELLIGPDGLSRVILLFVEVSSALAAVAVALKTFEPQKVKEPDRRSDQLPLRSDHIIDTDRAWRRTNPDDAVADLNSATGAESFRRRPELERTGTGLCIDRDDITGSSTIVVVDPSATLLISEATKLVVKTSARGKCIQSIGSD